MAIRVLVIPGSTRTDAFSKKLARAAGKLVAQAGAEATVIDLRDFAMPLYDGDLRPARVCQRAPCGCAAS